MVDDLPSSADDELLELIEELTDRVQSGNPSEVEELLQANPRYAAQLRSILPSLNILVKFKTSSSTGSNIRLQPSKEKFEVNRILGELGDYRIIREIGRGGMGVVYEAEQMSLGRQVALKVLPFAAILDQRQIQRFKNEAQAAAQLHHANIVPVYGVGCERGIYYYAMQYIEGQTLAEVIRKLQQVDRPVELPIENTRHRSISVTGNFFSDDWTGLLKGTDFANDPSTTGNSSSEKSPEQADETDNAIEAISTDRSIRSTHFFRNAANLGAQVADALGYAHQHGVVHRDIKPANLILDARGTAWVTDFGLARIESNPGMTMTGALLGTLRYMSPEQILAKPGVDHRTDIYSLGVTLYELLTLQPVVYGKDRHEFIKQIAVGQPLAPRKLNGSLPRELETILFKAIEKDPGQRYATAPELAEDLRRFVENRPIRARRPSLVDAIVKWSRRHSDLAWLSSTFLSIGLVVMAAAAIWIAQLNRETERQRQLVNDHLIETSKQKQIANEALAESERSKAKLRTELYGKSMNLAFTAWHNHWVEEVDRILLEQVPTQGEADLRGFEWHLLKQLTARTPPVEFRGHDGPVNDMAVFAGGTRIASVGNDGTIRVWDVSSQNELFQLPTDKAGFSAPQVFSAVAVSPNGKQLVTGKHALSLWDLENCRFVRKLMTFPTHVTSIAFSPDGTLVAAHSADQVLKVLSLADDTLHQFHTDHGSHRIAFSPDGSRLYAPYKKGSLRGISSWDTATWKVVREYEDKASPRGLVVSHDGRFLFHGTYGNFVRLIDMSNGEVVFDTPNHRSRTADVALSTDDRILAALYNDGTLTYWHLRQDWQSDPGNAIVGELTLLPAHDRPGNAVRFIDRQRVATCGNDGMIRIWEIKEHEQSRASFDSLNGRLAFSPDHTEIWLATQQGITICNSQTLETIQAIDIWRLDSENEQNATAALILSADQRFAVCGDEKGTIALLDRVDNREIYRLEQTDIRSSAIDDLAISPDGRWLACAGEDHTIRVRSMDDWAEVFRYDTKGLESSVEFSPGGQLLAISDSHSAIVLLATGSWQELVRATMRSPVADDCLSSLPTARKWFRDTMIRSFAFGIPQRWS